MYTVRRLAILAGLASVFASASVAPAVEVEPRGVTVIDGHRDLNKNGKIDPYENWRLPVDERVEDLLSRMTLDEKLGQVSYPNNTQDDDGAIPLSTKAEVDRRAGFVFNQAKRYPSAKSCAESTNLMQRWAESTRLGIPLIIGMDPHPMIYRGTRIVGGVRSMAMSATNDLELVKRVYQVWAKEMRAVGIHMTLGPQTDLATEPRGVRNLDTPGENALWASEMNRAIVEGLQGQETGKNSALACPKHFPGVGSTRGGHDHHATFLGEPPFPGDCNAKTPLTSTPESIKWHLKPYEGAIAAGTWAVMAPYYPEASPEFILDLPNRVEIMLEGWLRRDLGFQGVICTDWGNATPFADVQGGCDTARVSREFTAWLKDGKTDIERIDRSIRRILTAKFKLGLFEDPYVDPDLAEEVVDSEEHRAIAKEAAHRGQVVLKNEGNLIPLPDGKKILWADDYSPEEAGLLAEAHDVAVVSVTGYDGIWHRRYNGCDLELFVDDACSERLRAIHKTGTPIVAVYHVRGNPYPIPWVAENAAAILYAPGAYWYGAPGEKLGGGWREILTGEYEPSGKLQFQIPRSMEQVKAQREDLPYDLGCTEEEMDLIAAAIGKGEAPPKNLGDPLFAYGITGWGDAPKDTKMQTNKVDKITERTPSVPQYFSWINNTNEGSTEEHTLTNLDFFKWLYDEYGMRLGIYAFDAGNIDGIDGPRSYGRMDSEKFKRQFPNGWRPIADKAKSFGCRLGIWLGPDGYGDTPEEEAKRSEMLVSLCRDYNFQLFKLDLVSNLREEKQDAFARTMIRSREFAPDLIVLNHRVKLGKATPHATTSLMGGRETYIDVHMTNWGTGTHNRVAALSRKTSPGLTRLTEDHGVCLSSALDYWEDDLILQAFNRSFILAPEIYANPWLLRDDEFPKLARIYNLHYRNREILVDGMELPESYGPYPVARGDGATRFLTLRNLTWSPVTYRVQLDEEIGLTESGKVHVRRYHPAERILGDFDYGESVDIVVPPFRSYLLLATVNPRPELGIRGCDYEVVRDTKGKPALVKLLGMPGQKVSVQVDSAGTAYRTAALDGKRQDEILSEGVELQFPGAALSKPYHRKLADLGPVPVPGDAGQLYEATCFAASNNALEIQSLKRSGPTAIPQVAAARDAFFDQELFWRRGIWDKYLFDGNLDTFFGVYHWQFGDQRLDGGVFRLDLGQDTALDSLSIEALWPVDRTGATPDSFAADISSDLVNWRKVKFAKVAEQAERRVPVVQIHGNGGSHHFFDTRVYGMTANLADAGAFRYLRIPKAPDRIAEIAGTKDNRAVAADTWHATHLFAPYQAPQAAWQASIHVDKDTPKGSYLCVAIEGEHGAQKAFAALRMNGKWIGASQRAMSMPCVVWELITSKHSRNYTYYFPVTNDMLGQDLEAVAMAFEEGKTDLKPHIWTTAYPVPYESIELRLE